MQKTEIAYPAGLLAAVGNEEIERLRTLTLAEKKRELLNAFSMTAHYLGVAVVLVAEIESQAGDLNDVRCVDLHLFRKVAAGQLLFEVLVKLWGRRALLSRVANLPIPDQQKVAIGEGVAMLVQGKNGPETLYPNPLLLDLNQIKQVFDKDHIRSEEEQRLWLASQCFKSKSIETDFDEADTTVSVGCKMRQKRAVEKRAKTSDKSSAEVWQEVVDAGLKALRIK